MKQYGHFLKKFDKTVPKKKQEQRAIERRGMKEEVLSHGIQGSFRKLVMKENEGQHELWA